MKKYLLLYLFSSMCIIVSCSKTATNLTATNTVFVPVQIHLLYGGASLCSYGYFLIRQDSFGITYHTRQLPANTNLPGSGLVNIQFHDTIIPQTISCWPHEIVIDSIKK